METIYALVLFTLMHPVPSNPAVYEWRKETVFGVTSLAFCNAYAATLNADKPFEQNNEPYYACEKR